jgi:hypothetical protein
MPLLAAGIAGPGWAAERTGEVSLAAYRRLIADYDRGTRRGLSRPEAEALRLRLQHVLAVALPDGRLVTVDNSKEITTLGRAVATQGAWKANAPTHRRIALLNALVADAHTPRGAGDALQQGRAILATTEFKDAAASVQPKTAWETFLEGIQKTIRDFLDRLFRRQNAPDPKPVPWLAQFVVYTLYFLATVGALIGLYYLGRWAVERRAATGGERGRTGFDLGDLSLADPLASSRQLAERGDYRGALRLAYLASLQRLSRARLLVLRENRTNWEYQRALRSRSTLAYDVLLPATRLFDEAWYGDRQATPEEYEVVVAAHDALPIAAPPEPADTEAKVNADTSGPALPPHSPVDTDQNPW